MSDMHKKLLHIIASPRGEDSRTLKVSGVFLDIFSRKHPACAIESINLFDEPLQPLTIKMVKGKYMLLGGRDVAEEFKDAWKIIERYINQFLSADVILLSTPMWNFSIPYQLKHYIDIIIQPRYLFRYTANGAEGLAKNKKMIVVTSRGGDYSSTGPMAKSDHQMPYLKTVFGLCGITDMTFINAQPMDTDPAAAARALEAAKKEAVRAANAIGETV